MTRTAWLTLLVLAAAACSKPPPPSSEPAYDLAIHCGTVIDGISDEPRSNQVIAVRGKRIAAIMPAAGAAIGNATVINLAGQTCLPGLIDMHVHLDGYPDDADDYRIYLRRAPDDTRRISVELARVVLDAGFTTVRHTGAYLAWVDRDLRDRIEAGEVPGPRMQIAGPYLTIPRGGGDMYIPGVSLEDIPPYYRMGVAQGPQAFAARAQELVDGGAEFLKLIASGAVFGHDGDPGAPEMTFDEISAVVEVAKRAGIRTTAHAHSAQSIKDAIRAGVDVIEHASFADDEAIEMAAEQGVAFSMDVYNGTYTEAVGREKGYAEEFMRKNEETTDAQRIAFEKALAAGVPLVFGTDLGVLRHDLGARQFEVMVERGMTPMQAIRSATSVAAEFLDWQDDVGALEAGRFADLVAVDGNPLENIALLQSIRTVIKGGQVVRNEARPQAVIADTVYHTGKVYTVDEKQPWAQAVAIKDGLIVFVGSDDRVRRHIGPVTKIHDLRGRMMLPGFHARLPLRAEKDAPPQNSAQRLDALKNARDRMHGLGVTSVTAYVETDEDLIGLATLDDRGDLDLHVIAALPLALQADPVQHAIQLRDRFRQGNVNPAAVAFPPESGDADSRQQLAAAGFRIYEGSAASGINSPLLDFAAAVAEKGDAINETLAAAIYSRTLGAARNNELVQLTGSIEARKRADLVVLDRKSLFDIDPAELSSVSVLMTLFAGEVVHGSNDALRNR